MNHYRERSTGIEVEAQQLEGPTVLNTPQGEVCGEAGQWAVYAPANEGRPIVLAGAIFESAFEIME